MRSAAIALSLFSCSALELEIKRYDGHQVLRVIPESSEQVAALRKLDDDDAYDFWAEARREGIPVDVRCSPSECEALRSLLAELGISQVSTMIEDVQGALDKMTPNGLDDTADFDLGKYHTYEQTDAWMETLAQKYSSICQILEVGKSYEGKVIKAIKITGNKTNDANKKSFWMDGGIHAREWITTAVVNYMLGHTLEGYGQDAEITSIVDKLNIYYAPILNPDGYQVTWAADRMWRKTAKPNPGYPASCAGTDPNRNWDFHWNEAGSSSNPCSESYAGAAPADNPEVAAIQKYICSGDNFLSYINFHSYSQLWMEPWGYTYNPSPDADVQIAGGAAAVAALTAVHGTRYTNGPIAKVIYQASGSSADYAYGTCKVLFSYGVELRDTGSYGFVLPPSEILPSGEETFAGIKALAKYMIAHEEALVTV